MGQISKAFNYNINCPKITHVILSKKNGILSLPDFHMIEPEFYMYEKNNSLLLKEDSRFAFCNSFLQPETNVFMLRDKLITQGEKRGTSTKPPTEQCFPTS